MDDPISRFDCIVERSYRRLFWLMVSVSANVFLAFLVAVSVSKGCL